MKFMTLHRLRGLGILALVAAGALSGFVASRRFSGADIASNENSAIASMLAFAEAQEIYHRSDY